MHRRARARHAEGKRTAVEVGHAAGGVAPAGAAAAAWPCPRDGDDGQVVPVDEADVVVVQVGGVRGPLPQRDLEQRRGRRRAGAGTLQPPAAVAGLARALAVRVEHAARARPYPAGPRRRRRDLHALPRVQPEPRRRQLRRARAGERPRPYGLGAVVGYGEGGARHCGDAPVGQC